MSVCPLVVMLSYIIGACDNKEPLWLCLHHLLLCASVGNLARKRVLTRLCVHIGLGLGFKAEPWLVRGLSERQRGKDLPGWPGPGLAANAPNTQPQLTTPYFQVHVHLHSFLQRQLALLDLSPIEAV